MKITEISQCNNRIGGSWEARLSVGARVPAYIWRGVLLAGDPRAEVAIDLSDVGLLEEVLRDLYGELSLLEIAELVLITKNFGWNLEPQKVMIVMGIEGRGFYKDLLKQLLELPLELIRWLGGNKFSPSDLRPLISVENIGLLKSDLLSLTRFSWTHSDAVKGLEWVVELHLLGIEFSQMLAQSKGSQEAISALQSLRYPLAETQKNSQAKSAQSLPWPRRVQARPVRKGDQSGIEIKFFAKGRRDLESYIAGLQDVAQSMRGQSQDQF